MADETLIQLLLSRRPEKATLSSPNRFSGAVVAVTGAGGSIGGEICRQLAPLRPRLLLLIGHGERSLFAIAQELSERFSDFRIVLADVADAGLIDWTFQLYRPNIVIHTAAHKHVPIVEQNIAEAARTNALGAHVVAQCAARAGAEDVLLLSTDKAVRPVNVLGLTKLAAETIWRAVPPNGGRFTTVRFGNVLGSRGSVLEVFQRQLAGGVPLSLTDRRMRRFFSTVGECASWILRAVELAEPNRLFVLDSGEEIAILTIAQRLLAAAGADQNTIVETGMRAGEKLAEQLLSDEERSLAVGDGKLLIVDRPAWRGDLPSAIEGLTASIRTHDDAGVLSALERFAPVDTSDAVRAGR